MGKITLLLSLLAFLISPCAAEIKNLEITSDTRTLILFEKFGFTPRGHVNISISNVKFSSGAGQADPSLFGFFLLSDESLLKALYDSEQRSEVDDANPNPNPNPYCVLSSRYVLRLFNFKELAEASHSVSYPITHPDEYSLYFASCVPDSQITMAVRTAMYNLQPDGKPDFLSVGQSRLPTLYSVFAVAYAIFLGIWIYICLIRYRPFSHKIHLLMGGLLLAKALNLLFAAEDQHFIKVSGTPHGWDVLFYIFQFLRGVLLFTVIVLIGTGWSFLKPFLQDREKKVLMIVIPLQVLANIASAVVGETGPFIQDWITWNQVFLIVDIICCCAILFPIVWSIRTLKETSKTDGKAARNLAKLTLFRQFYIVVVGYLYFTRIVVFALATIASYKYRWVSVAAGETASLAFYAFMFHMFQPAERNEYFVIGDDEEEAAAVQLREEEFEL